MRPLRPLRFITFQRALAGTRSAVLAAGLAAAGAAAQQPIEVADGFLDAMRVSWTAVSERCVTPLRTGFVVPAADSSCRVVEVARTGATDRLEWYVARYRRLVVMADSVAPDTMDLDELVLLGRAAGAPEARAAWHQVRDRDYAILDTLEWLPTTRGPFLALWICYNGTAGCYAEHLRWDGRRWRAVVDGFTRILQSRLPTDHWLRGGREIDLEALTAVWPVAGPEDANCCPSFEIPFTLRLVADTLVLADAGPLRPHGRR